MDTYNYKGWLTSDKFYKRMLAVWGYQVAFSFWVFIIFFVVGFIAGLMGMHF